MPAATEISPDRRVARFGAFEFYPESRELRKHGHRVRLQEQPGIILQLLLERPGEIVTRERLKQELWPSTTFGEYEAGLNTAVSKLRAALSDSTANPIYIERLPKLGYRFVAPVVFAEAVVPQRPSTVLAIMAKRPVPDEPSPEPDEIPAPPPELPASRRKWLLWGLAAIFGIGLIGWIVGRLLHSPRAAESGLPAVVRYTITLPPNQVLAVDGGRVVAISGDGRSIAYIAMEAGSPQIFSKQVGEEEFRPLPGTQDAADLFFSPDGSSLVFWAKSHLVRIDMETKSTAVLANWGPKNGHPSGFWSDDGSIYYGNQVEGSPGILTAIFRLDPARHSAPLPRKPPPGDESLFPNQLLNDSELLCSRNLGPEDRATVLYSFRDGSEKVLVEPAMGGFYLPTGHLIYSWKGDLLAAPFSLSQMAVTGSAVTVVRDIAPWRWAGVQAVVSNTGTLVWVPAPSDNRQLVWVDRTGRESPLDLPPSPYDLLALSPKGDRVLIERRDNSRLRSIWDYNMASRGWTRLVSGEWEGSGGTWSPDETKVAVSAILRGEKFENLYLTPVSSPAPERLAPSPTCQYSQAWSARAGLIFTGCEIAGKYKEVLGIQPETGQKPVVLVSTKANNTAGSVSPDGQWLAYASDISGREEVYVQRLAGSGPAEAVAIRITDNGGRAPLWSPVGGEVFYRHGNAMWSVEFRDGKPGEARELFSGPYTVASAWNRRYSVTPDGQRFLMMRDVADPEDFRQIHVAVNWSSELARTVPGAR